MSLSNRQKKKAYKAKQREGMRQSQTMRGAGESWVFIDECSEYKLVRTIDAEINFVDRKELPAPQ